MKIVTNWSKSKTKVGVESKTKLGNKFNSILVIYNREFPFYIFFVHTNSKR